MRPEILTKYQPTMAQKCRLWMTSSMFGKGAYEMARAAFYRSGLFMQPYLAMQNKALRARSAWSVAERELFGACVASKLRCEYCRITHAEFASHANGATDWADHLKDSGMEGANDPRLAAMGIFLERLTMMPWDITADDLLPLQQMGISAKEIREAVAVCIVFNIGSRVALSLGLQVPTREDLRKAAPFILRLGYKVLA